MVLLILRALFVLLMAAIGYYFVQKDVGLFQIPSWLMLTIMLSVGVLIVCIDILSPRRKLAIFSGTFFGLIVGMITTYGFSLAIPLLADTYMPGASDAQKLAISKNVDIVIGVVFTYLAISFVLQTKDDFRFIIPYVEFSKQTKGSRPMLLDTSVLIDGRVADIAETGILESRLIVPRFVLSELQTVADSGDKLKRNRGRRGLDVLQRLQSNKRTEVIMYDSSVRDAGPEDVDAKLMNLAAELNGRVLTNDFNLNKVASLRGVDVININDLANALKPVVLPGERMTVRLLKPGESPGQGVGYLVDGTMVVVEQGRPHLNEEIEFTVTSVLQTSAGKMIFGRLPHEAPSKVS
ncbi:MAG: PIN domain-containing protein [Tepidisphaeraceae bacterium]